MPNEIEKESFEVERKFLVKELPEEILKDIKPLEFTQTYLTAPKGEEKRVRMIYNPNTKTKEFRATRKFPKTPDGLARSEEEVDINNENIYLEMLKLKDPNSRTIKKLRYIIPVGDSNYELDIYQEDLSPLKVVEIEFTGDTLEEAIESAKKFDSQIPYWFGDEVTSDPRYKNNYLAKNGIPNDSPKRDTNIYR